MNTHTCQLTTQLLTSWAEVDAIRNDWQQLLTASDANCLFLTPEWIDAWRQAVTGIDVQPCVVQIHNRAGETVGIAPFYVARQYLLSTLPLRVLRIMGDFPTGAVYGTVIAHPACSEAVHELVFETLMSQPVDAVWMPHVATWNGTAAAVRQAALKAGFKVMERASTLYHMDLPETYEAYEQTLSKSTRKDFRRSRRKLLEDAEGLIRRCRSAETLPGFLSQLIELNARRWRGEARKGVFERKPREAAFYQAFTPVALERGWLRFAQLDVGGAPVASEIGYVYDNTYFAMQAGLDLDGPPGSGKVLLNDMLRTVIGEGVRQFDFMTGDASYKSRYAAGTRETAEFFLVSRSLRALPLRSGRIWPRGRFLDFTEPKAHHA